VGHSTGAQEPALSEIEIPEHKAGVTVRDQTPVREPSRHRQTLVSASGFLTPTSDFGLSIETPFFAGDEVEDPELVLRRITGMRDRDGDKSAGVIE
jgi:hypothetical protein